MNPLVLELDELLRRRVEQHAAATGASVEDLVRDMIVRATRKPPLRWQGLNLLIGLRERAVRQGIRVSMVELRSIWLTRHLAADDNFERGLAQLHAADAFEEAEQHLTVTAAGHALIWAT